MIFDSGDISPLEQKDVSYPNQNSSIDSPGIRLQENFVEELKIPEVTFSERRKSENE